MKINMTLEEGRMKADAKTIEELSHEREGRLHRVMIQLDRKNIKCQYSNECNFSENCLRCNVFFVKCSNFKEVNLNSLQV